VVDDDVVDITDRFTVVDDVFFTVVDEELVMLLVEEDVVEAVVKSDVDELLVEEKEELEDPLILFPFGSMTSVLICFSVIWNRKIPEHINMPINYN
jgi:hypothetical protein